MSNASSEHRLPVSPAGMLLTRPRIQLLHGINLTAVRSPPGAPRRPLLSFALCSRSRAYIRTALRGWGGMRQVHGLGGALLHVQQTFLHISAARRISNLAGVPRATAAVLQDEVEWSTGVSIARDDYQGEANFIKYDMQ